MTYCSRCLSSMFPLVGDGCKFCHAYPVIRPVWITNDHRGVGEFTVAAVVMPPAPPTKRKKGKRPR